MLYIRNVHYTGRPYCYLRHGPKLMNKLRHVSLVAALLAVIMLVFSSPQSLQAQSASVNTKEDDKSTRVESDPYESHLFKIRGTPDLQVNLPVGAINVIHNPDAEGVKVDLHVKREFSLWSGYRSLEGYRIIMQQRGDQIIASVEDKRPSRNSGSVEFYFDIQVPGEFSSNLRTHSGPISLNGANGKHFLQNQTGNLSIRNSEGDLRASTTTGTIQLQNLGGNIFAKTVSGHIQVQNNRGEVRLRSVSGSIEVEKLSGTLVSATTSGNIQAHFTDVSIGIYMETVTGNINLQLPPFPGYQVQARAMQFDFDELDSTSITSRRLNSREASLVLREGDLPVELSSISGKITIQETQKR